MGQQLVTISDLSGSLVSEDDRLTIIVHAHPEIEAPVRLDCGAWEIEGIGQKSANYVLVEICSGEQSVRKAVDVETFNELFKVDVNQALKKATPVGGKRALGGKEAQRTKRNPEELRTIRAWARQNGWPDLSDRGRIPQEAETAYMRATA